VEKTLKYATWVFIALALVFLWLSLRSETDQVKYSIVGLAMFGLGQGANYWLKKLPKSED
jgi:hypothetical protein